VFETKILKKIFSFTENETRVDRNNCVTNGFVFLNIHQISPGLSNAKDGRVTGMGDIKHAYKNVMIKSEERRMNFKHQIEL
jgi:hypothetical protein